MKGSRSTNISCHNMLPWLGAQMAAKLVHCCAQHGLPDCSPSQLLKASRALQFGTLQGQADQWRTFDSQTQQACQGATCVAVSVIECYPVGGAPLGPDGNGNVGCGNTGSGNTGSWNTGSNNHGSCNAGEAHGRAGTGCMLLRQCG